MITLYMLQTLQVRQFSPCVQFNNTVAEYHRYCMHLFKLVVLSFLNHCNVDSFFFSCVCFFLFFFFHTDHLHYFVAPLISLLLLAEDQMLCAKHTRNMYFVTEHVYWVWPIQNTMLSMVVLSLTYWFYLIHKKYGYAQDGQHFNIDRGLTFFQTIFIIYKYIYSLSIAMTSFVQNYTIYFLTQDAIEYHLAYVSHCHTF